MNFAAGNEGMDCDINEDIMDDDMVYTPSAATEDASSKNMQRTSSTTTKNEYDIDMDDTEETKEDPTVAAIASVPIENYRVASKQLGVEMLDQEQSQTRMVTMPVDPQALSMPQGGHSQGRRQSDPQGGDHFDNFASKRATRQGSIDTHVDISAIDDEARRLSWQRLMQQNLETISAEQFENNMRRLSDLEAERRQSSILSNATSGSRPRQPSVKKLNIQVLIADMEINEQVKIEHELKPILSDGLEGYDLGALIDIAMEVYDLDPQFGVQVDYWSNSMQTYLICDNLFVHRRSNASQASHMSTLQHLICEEDFTISNEGKPCLLIRFKNCTGNIIELDDKQHIVNPIEFAQAQIALSIDSQFKNQRNRTVTQAIDMVLRQRTISMGYYDFQIRRYVKPMTLEQAAKNLDLRHQMLTGEDQHIEKKTLDDYYAHIRTGNDSKNPYNFSANQDELVKCLRKHCQETKGMQ